VGSAHEAQFAARTRQTIETINRPGVKLVILKFLSAMRSGIKEGVIWRICAPPIADK
jgi:hypothetical protein